MQFVSFQMQQKLCEPDSTFWGVVPNSSSLNKKKKKKICYEKTKVQSLKTWKIVI